MSEREGGSGFGPFLLGVSLGAVLGFLFAGYRIMEWLAGR